MAQYCNRAREAAERLIILRDYLYTNASPTHAVKMADILEYLVSKQHEVEIKTVYSGLKSLKYFLNVDTKYNGSQRGYLLLNPPFQPYELRSIVNSIQAAKFITQQEADELTQKIMKLTDEHTRPSLNRQTYVHNRVRAVDNDLMQKLDSIYEAIAQDSKISYKYFHYPSNRDYPKWYAEIDGSKTITTSPHGVHWNGDYFSILATRRANENDKIYMLQLNHMEEIKILSKKREGKDVAQKYLKYGFGHENHVSSSSMKTKLRVDGMDTSMVIEKFGGNIPITPMGGGYFIATIDGFPTPELYLWTLKFQPRIKIIFQKTQKANYGSILRRLRTVNNHYRLISNFLRFIRITAVFFLVLYTDFSSLMFNICLQMCKVGISCT